MHCEIAKERIAMAAYGELPGEFIDELERHLFHCAACRAEQEQVLALLRLADACPATMPSPNLVARARLRLDEALDVLPPRSWRERLGARLRNNLAGLRAAPVAALLLAATGAGAGLLAGARLAQDRSVNARIAPTANPAQSATQFRPTGATQPDATLPALANVASISGIVRHPHSQIVDVRLNQIVPRQIEGSLDDPQMRKLLLLATQKAPSAGVRGDSVALLADECRTGRGCQTADMREALMVALRTDRSPAVREKALLGLQPYVAVDMRVRDAILKAVLNDNDPSIRSAAIGLLTPDEADTSVRQVLYSVSNYDNSPQIRNVSRQVLSQVPEIQ